MITGFILNSFYILVYNLFYFLPDGGDLPAVVLSASASLGGMLYSMNSFLPITALLAVLGWTVVLLLAISGIKLIKWIIATVRGSGVGI